jgi:hypothetical protein
LLDLAERATIIFKVIKLHRVSTKAVFVIAESRLVLVVHMLDTVSGGLGKDAHDEKTFNGDAVSEDVVTMGPSLLDAVALLASISIVAGIIIDQHKCA